MIGAGGGQSWCEGGSGFVGAVVGRGLAGG